MILIPYNRHLFTDVVNFIQKIDDSLDEEGEFGKKYEYHPNKKRGICGKQNSYDTLSNI